MTTSELIHSLESIVGADNVLTDRSDLAMRENDARGPLGKALALVRPADAAEVAEIVRLAAREHIRLVPQGARTGLVGGGTADDSGAMLLLSLERLRQVIEIDVTNRTAHVSAGVPLSRLNDAAAEHGLFFPIDLGADPTIGGMVAANTGGARFLRYGDVRRNLLSVEFVTSEADARIERLGRDCWKQNDSLDLKHLVIGTSGSTGIVTAATVALQPLPAHSVTALLALTDAAAIGRLLVQFERSWGMLLTAFEGISLGAYEAALRHVPRLRRPFVVDPDHKFFLLIELSAGDAFDDQMLEDALGAGLQSFLDGHRPLIADVAVDRHDGLWGLRHAIPASLWAAGSVIACDVALRRGDVIRFRAAMIAEIERDYPSLTICDFGHVGDGGLHFNMVWSKDAGPMPWGLADDIRARVMAEVVEVYGGSFSAEHGVGPRNMVAYRRFTSPWVQLLAGKVQSLIAPTAVGRVAFGAERQ